MNEIAKGVYNNMRFICDLFNITLTKDDLKEMKDRAEEAARKFEAKNLTRKS